MITKFLSLTEARTDPTTAVDTLLKIIIWICPLKDSSLSKYKSINPILIAIVFRLLSYSDSNF